MNQELRIKNSELKTNGKSYLTGGFTLIEIIVAVGVFAIVMTVSLAAFLNLIDMQWKTESFRKVNGNLNYAMEAITRDIRAGNGYSSCGAGCFSFTDSTGAVVIYKLETGSAGGYISRTVNSSQSMMTADDVNITGLSFDIDGTRANDSEQPLVVIRINGESGLKEKLKSKLNIQATVAQRKLDSGS